MSSRAARPIFCGNLDYDARQSDIERLFGKYGKVEKVDLKSDDQDADDAVRRLDRREFGPKGRRLRVEWTKQDRGGRQYGDSRKASMKSQPSRTLFIINFDPIITRLRDLERHFDSYGKIVNVRIRRNFAFVQFETQEEATKALDATNSSKFMDRILSVEYATRDDDDNQRSDDRRNDRSPYRRGRDRSPERGYNSRRSPSPLRRDRDSPDYGHGSKPISRYEPRRSPNYERNDKSLVNNVDIKRSSRHERQRSPSNDSPGRSPVNDRDTKLNYDGPDRSPANDDNAMLSSEHEPYESPIYGRTKRSPGGARDSSRSPSPTER